MVVVGPARLVCITGMHRSGTSLAARVLNLVGVDLGPEDAMMEATEANPRGYWEAEPISELNDELLKHLGGWWKDVPPLPAGWEHDPELDGFRERAGELLDELFGGAEVGGFKDPRASLVLPFWRTVRQVDATVLVLRPVEEVCGSLHRREDFDPERSASLWIDHTVGAWLHDPSRIVVTYPGLLTDPVAAARRVARALGLPDVDEETAERIEEFRDPDLRRSAGFDAGDGPQVRGARALYELLSDGAPPAEVNGVLQRLWDDRDATRHVEREREDVRQRLHEKDMEIEDLRDRVWDLNATLRQIGGEDEDPQEAVDRLTRERLEWQAEAERWRREFERLRDRRSVKTALKAAEALRPLVQAVKRDDRDR